MNRPAIPPEKESTAQQFALPGREAQEDFHRGLKEIAWEEGGAPCRPSRTAR
jgi:hypothetical protein